MKTVKLPSITINIKHKSIRSFLSLAKKISFPLQGILHFKKKKNNVIVQASTGTIGFVMKIIRKANLLAKKKMDDKFMVSIMR
jgi:hypothetical protein